MITLFPILVSSVPFRPPPSLVVNVRRVKQLTPHMIRITSGGEQMASFHYAGPASQLRVFLPDSETGEPALPVQGPEGNVFSQGGGCRSVAPTRRVAGDRRGWSWI